MGERVFLVHGWSVQDTTTYQALHLQLARSGFALEEIFLGRYVTLEDRVEIGDIASALHLALDEKLGGDWTLPFHILTHSTGALVVRHWISRHYQSPRCDARPLKNLVFLAGPHFGSRLAHHGRSMLAHLRYLGETGERVLDALELGSAFNWEQSGDWMDESLWRAKGIRPWCLTGDRVRKTALDAFAAKILPAGFETGSDMVVRCASANLNFERFEIRAAEGLRKVGGIEGVPFAALGDFVHSGPECGIMNSIRKSTKPESHRALALILRCLLVKTDAEQQAAAKEMEAATCETRKRRSAYAQLDFRFRDDTGAPIGDYAFKLGWLDEKGRPRPSRAVASTHKNRRCPNQFTAFIDLTQIDPEATYFMEFDSSSGSSLFSYQPDPLYIDSNGHKGIIAKLLQPDRTTQFDVILSRVPDRNLFVFHPGNDGDLHLKWDRAGEVVKRRLEIE